ncbi:hypothetical protein [Acinetobacter sp. c3-l95]|uniref:phage tail tube protein n=1 Tax=Acinetobacter sp. c3-l95 TaxID=3342804 RepID=UPI0035BB1321
MALHGKKYAGDLWGRKYGSTDAFQKLGNLTELKATTKSKTETLPSTGKNDYGQAIEVETIPEPTEISLKFNTFDKDGLARALMGTAYDLTTSPVTFADEEHIVSTGGIKLANKDIDPATLVLTDDRGGTIDKTTYSVNARLGMVEFNATSKLLAGAKFKAAGKTKASAGFMINASTLQSLPLEMYLDGKDRISGKDGIVDMPHAVLAAEGDIDFMSDKWWESGLKGTLVKDDGKESMTFTEYA